MSDSIITVENLSKKYVISHKQEQHYTAMRDVLVNGAKNIGRKILRKKVENSSKEDFWALKDINFEIKKGDRVGIIGRNGAGKSTLLKILSRITEPTTGKIHLRGRVASLLEVGTGFHPELTGRENIFLNGAIMGMSKWEIKKKFDEIVDFAEVEKFLDTPVKRYSSGMYVRLAFAVAAHLEPEILVVDEVLAVGDAQFQKKCLGKMEDVGKEGRTVIFVSHNMEAVMRLCNRGFVLDKGQIILEGGINDIYNSYSSKIFESSLAQVSYPNSGECPIYLKEINIKDQHDKTLNVDLPFEGNFQINIKYDVRSNDAHGLYIMCAIASMTSLSDVIWMYDGDTNYFKHRGVGSYTAKIKIDESYLKPGKYYLRVGVIDYRKGAVDFKGDICPFSITDSKSFLSKHNIEWPTAVKGNFIWEVHEES